MEKNKKNFNIYLTTNNNSGYKSKKSHIANNFPLLYIEINIFSNDNNLTNIPFREQLFLFLNNLKSIPICPVCKKKLIFKKSFKDGYGKYCSINCANMSDDHKKNVKNTNLKKFGGTAPIHSEMIKEKIKQTNLKKYGVDNIFKITNYLKTQTQNKYGVNHISQLDYVKKKKKETNLKKYGVSTPVLLKSSRQNFIDSKSINFRKKYKHLNVISINYNDITIKCDICQKEYTINRSLLYNRNRITNNPCTYCHPIKKGVSISETDIGKFINELNIEYLSSERTILNKQELDIYIQSHKIAIEFDGLFWHNELFCDKNYHSHKTDQCLKKDIHLIHIFEDEWIYKQDIVKSRLKNLLGLTENKIYARKCVIKNVSTKEYCLFLEKNHIQGNVKSSVKIGLYYNDNLVSVMSFGNLRKSLGSKSKQGVYEMLRFCNILNTNVVGGANRLLKWFILNYKPKEIISYADRRWSKGDLYYKLGFNLVRISKPNYFYVINDKRENRFKYRKNILTNDGFDKNKTEKEIMFDRKIYRIYDSGSYVFKLSLCNF